MAGREPRPAADRPISLDGYVGAFYQRSTGDNRRCQGKRIIVH